MEKKNQMWKDLVDKVDKIRNPREYWREIGRMSGRKTKIRTETMKNENGVELKTREEIERAFRRRLERTFRITEEDNEDFCEENERMVEEWITQRREDLVVKNIIHNVDTPEIKPELIVDILKDFKEKSPGPSGITRNFFIKHTKNLK